MPYLEHWLLSFGGHQGDTNETWTCGIRLHEIGIPTGFGVDPEEYLDDPAVPALSTWFGGGAMVLAAAKLQWVKFNRIGPDGRYADPGATHLREINVSGGVSGPTNVHPLQVAYCLSFRNDEVPRGLASHGRIYVPRPVVAVTDAGDISGSYRVDMANAGATLLNTLDVGVETGVLRPAIESRGGGEAPWPNPGVYNEINRVVVDSELDIQRRRARSQSREVTSAAVVY